MHCHQSISRNIPNWPHAQVNSRISRGKSIKKEGCCSDPELSRCWLEWRLCQWGLVRQIAQPSGNWDETRRDKTRDEDQDWRCRSFSSGGLFIRVLTLCSRGSCLRLRSRESNLQAWAFEIWIGYSPPSFAPSFFLFLSSLFMNLVRVHSSSLGHRHHHHQCNIHTALTTLIIITIIIIVIVNIITTIKNKSIYLSILPSFHP